MPFAKGQSGNPSGAKPQKPIWEALKRANAQEDSKRIRAMIEKILDLAASGERWACEFLRDVMDGKPNQAIEINGDLRHSYVAELPSVAATTDEWLSRVQTKLPARLNS